MVELVRYRQHQGGEDGGGLEKLQDGGYGLEATIL